MRVNFGLLVAVLAMAMNGWPAIGAPVKIRLAWIASPPELEPVLFAEPGVAKHLGRTYTLDTVHFQGTSPIITGLASGDVDIGPLAYSSFATAIINARMNDLRIIADEFRDGVDGYFSAEYMVRSNSNIASPKDLKGKVLATNAIGTANYIGMVALLERYHLSPQRDFTVIEAPLPSMKAMLLAQKADLIGTSPLIAYDPQLRSNARVLYTQKDSMGPTQMTFFVARAPFLKEHRAAVVDFMEDELNALHWYLDPANREKAVAILAQFTKRPPQLLDGWVFTKKDYYRDPDGLPDLDTLQHNIDTQLQLGLIKDKIDVKQYVDLSIVKEAALRLK